MIIFPTRELVLITPPHTASRNLTAALLDPQNDIGPWYAVHGLVPDSCRVHDHHYCTLHPEHLTWRVACVVRHPLDRLIGLHTHWVTAVGSKYPESPLQQWKKFARQVALGERSGLSWMYRWTIADLLTYHGHDPYEVQPIKFESLATELENLLETPIVLPPRFGHSHRDPWGDRYDSRLRAQASNWAAQDLLAWYSDG